MSAFATAQAAMRAPQPFGVDHGDGIPVVYNCHMAALHWVLRGEGRSDEVANTVVSNYAKRYCPRCRPVPTGIGHVSVPNSQYGADLCRNAVPVANAAALRMTANVGDVVISGVQTNPNHSMIVHSVTPGGPVMIYGFNNASTLGIGPGQAYDTMPRDITNANLWRPQGFGAGGADPLSVISHANYARMARTLAFAFAT